MAVVTLQALRARLRAVCPSGTGLRRFQRLLGMGVSKILQGKIHSKLPLGLSAIQPGLTGLSPVAPAGRKQMPQPSIVAYMSLRDAKIIPSLIPRHSDLTLIPLPVDLFEFASHDSGVDIDTAPIFYTDHPLIDQHAKAVHDLAAARFRIDDQMGARWAGNNVGDYHS